MPTLGPGSFSIERHGLLNVKSMINTFLDDMIDNGFTLKHPATFVKADDTTATTTATLEAGPTVDPLAATYPWRIRFVFTPTSPLFVSILVGSPVTLADDGTASVNPDLSTQSMGRICNPSNLTELNGKAIDRTIWGFNTAEAFNPTNPATVPISFAYILTISPRGIAVCFWAEGYENTGKAFTWFVIQRPVHPTTGEALIKGHCPVFCVYSCGGGGSSSNIVTANGIERFTVRETDILTPSDPVSAVEHSQDYNALVNPIQQVSFTEDNQYVLTFPNGLNTSRHVFPHELDLFAFTSADVIAQGSIVRLTMYGEANINTDVTACAATYSREYQALGANGPLNTGMRLLFLINGGGVVKSPTPSPIAV